MIPVKCSICGKKCKVKTKRYDEPGFNERVFKCRDCNHSHHAIGKQNVVYQEKIKKLAAMREVFYDNQQ
jgi:C4-type Zn-finger protein